MMAELAEPHLVFDVQPRPAPAGVTLPAGIRSGQGRRRLQATVERDARVESRDVLFLDGADAGTGVLSYRGNTIEWIVQESRGGRPVVGSHNKLLETYLDRIADPRRNVQASLEFSNEGFLLQLLDTLRKRFDEERQALRAQLTTETASMNFQEGAIYRIDRYAAFEETVDARVAAELYRAILRLYPPLASRAIRLDTARDLNGNNPRYHIEILSPENTRQAGGPQLLGGARFVRAVTLGLQESRNPHE